MDSRRRVRETIAAMCELRESQSALERCVARADRSFDDNVRERRALERQCATLRGKLDALERPARDAAKLRAVARAAAPLVYDPSLKRVDGIAEVFPGWYASVARVRSLADAKRCLATLDARSPKWRATQLKAVPKLAVPPCVSASERLLPLQNLPAWQSARVTLLACVLANSTKRPAPARVRQLAQSLGVHEKYVDPLQSLVAR